MIHATLKKGICLLLAACLCFALAMPSFASYPLPLPPAGEDESIYLLNRTTGEVLLNQEGETVRYVASTTKMMTALLLIESGYDLSTVITIPTRLSQEFIDIQAENGVDMELQIGEEIALQDLLYGLLLRSANDAASVIADLLGARGSVGEPASNNEYMNRFFDQMNARAVELGCTATHFTCAHGLYDAGNVSTAKDLALIAEACANTPLFMQIATTLEYTVHAGNKHSYERKLVSTNPMMNPESEYYRDYISGMKTGFTDLAGRCFVTTASKDGNDYLLVVLNSVKDEIYTECGALLDWAFANFTTRSFLSKDTVMAQMPLTNSYDATEFPLYPDRDVSGYAHLADEITYQITVDEKATAPIAVGDEFGTVDVYRAGNKVDTVNLITRQSFEDQITVDLRNTKQLLPYLLLALGLLTILSRLAARRRK